MNEDEELEPLEVDAEADPLDDDEGRPSVILEDNEKGQIIRVGRRAEEEEDWEEDGEHEEDATTPEQSAVAVSDEPAVEPAKDNDVTLRGEQEDTPAGPVEVPQYNGFSLTPDRLGLFEEAYEDANSEEAERLIYGEVDEDGAVVTKGIGEREYGRRCSAYEVSKLQYAQSITEQVDHTINAGLASIKEEVSSLSSSLATRLKVAPEDIEGLETFQARAFELIDSDRAMRKNYYTSQGYPDATAIKLADRDVLGYKGVVTLALKAAMMEKEDEWAEIVYAAKSKAKARTGEPVKAVEARPAPPVTSTTATPAATPGRPGGTHPDVGPAKLTREDLRKYPKAQLEVARSLGMHPDKLN